MKLRRDQLGLSFLLTGAVAVVVAVVAMANPPDAKVATPIKTEGCWVLFHEHDDYTRGKVLFGGPVQVPRADAYEFDNGEDVGDNIDSLVTGPKAWLEVYEDEEYDDTVKRYGPNTKVPRLDAQGIGDNIDSFRLYDKKPAGW
jgi:hypothetical protein